MLEEDGQQQQQSYSRTNWNLSFETFPATIVYAQSIADIVDCVTDEKQCPTPVRPIGSMASVTSCVIVDDGSLIDMSGMNRVLQFNETTGIITLEAGVKLGDLHPYLLRQNPPREISFQPEMGLATVGSLTVTTGKDSSVNGPGYFNALVTSLKYVNHQGELIHLDRDDNDTAQQFQEFLCSWGLLGIVVEVSLETRPAEPILTRFRATRLGVKGADKAFKIMQDARKKADNLYFLLSPEQGVVVSMERYALGPNAPKQNWIYRHFNSFFLMIIQRVAYYTIQHGVPYTDARLELTLKNLGIVDTIAKMASYWVTTEVKHYRSDFTNRYAPVTRLQDRLDFSLFFFSDETKLEHIFKDTYEFTVQWHQQTGFAPSGFNMYFVQRTGRTQCGMFAGPPGVSFAIDPYHSNPDSPQWKQFVQALTKRNLQHGAILSPTQSRFLRPDQFHYDHPSLTLASLYWQLEEEEDDDEPSNLPLFTSATNTTTNATSGTTKTGRFMTPFYQQFLSSSSSMMTLPPSMIDVND